MRSAKKLTVAMAAVALTAGALPAWASTTTRTISRINGSQRAAAPASTIPGRAVKYAVNVPLCAQPKNPYAIRCFAMRRLTVAKGTPGAYAYRVRPSYTTGPAGGFTPADIASAYGINPKSGGKGKTIGIVDWYDDPHALHDLNWFDHHYGLPTETSTSFRKVNQKGKASPLPQADAQSSGEIALDIQAARAVCNHCKIILIEADAPYNTDLAAAENKVVAMGASVVSNSFGGPENPKFPVTKSQLAAFRHPGVPILASTGDNGWFDWDFANAGKGKSDDAPNFPSSDPSVIAVGGTALALNGNGTRREEDVWNENGPDDDNAVFNGSWIGGAEGASGGGCSTVYKATAWQKQTAGYSATGCAGKRMTGDIAALADPYTGFDIYDTYEGGWLTVGGTSLASPLIASMWALAGGDSGAVYPSQTLYTNFASNPGSLYDVTLGGNGWCAGDDSQNCASVLSAESNDGHGNPGNGNPNGLKDPKGKAGGEKDCSFPRDGSALVGDPFSLECNAATGYDGPSGIGTPSGLGVFHKTNPAVAITAPAKPKHGKVITISVTATSRVSGAHPVSYVFAWGDGTTSTHSSTHSAKHKYAKAGSYQVTVTVTDSASQQGYAVRKLTVN